MTQVPAYCAQCGDLFPSGIALRRTGRADLSGNRVQCPNCRGMAEVASGTFSEGNDELRLIDGPPLTKMMLARLKDIAERAQKEIPTAELLLAEVAGVSPELAARLGRHGLSALALLAVLITLLQCVSFNVTIDVNRLIDQAWGEGRGEAPEPLQQPAFPAGSSLSERSTLAATQPTAPSRQVRRLLERQARKRGIRGGSELA